MMETEQTASRDSSRLLYANWSQLAWLCALLLFALAGLNFRWQPSSSPLAAQTPQGDLRPDIIIEQPQIDEFDRSGIRIQQLNGARLEHFDAANRSLVDMPIVQFQQKGQPPIPWHLKADTATLLHNSNKIELLGHVILFSDATAGGRTEITTEQLQLDTARQFAETDKAVTIRARRSEAHAAGLKADLANERLVLPARVKETHESRRR